MQWAGKPNTISNDRWSERQWGRQHTGVDRSLDCPAVVQSRVGAYLTCVCCVPPLSTPVTVRSTFADTIGGQNDPVDFKRRSQVSAFDTSPAEREVTSAAAREGISTLCRVYIPVELPLMGLESLKMRFSWPGKLLAGRNVQGFMHFWCGTGRSRTLKRLHDLLGEAYSDDLSQKEKSCTLCVCVF